MRISIVGHDPAGLYAGILLRRARPDWQIVLSGGPNRHSSAAAILANPVRPEFSLRDSEVAAAIHAQTLTSEGVRITRCTHGAVDEKIVEGLPYKTISGTHLHRILLEQALAAGCIGTSGTIAQNVENADLAIVSDPDLLRDLGGEAASLFAPTQETGRLRLHVRLGRKAARIEFGFSETPHGAATAMLIPSTPVSSTLFVEADAALLKACGLLDAGAAQVAEWCAQRFRPLIGDAPLALRGDGWTPARQSHASQWHNGNIALIGPAASSPHYSVGLATRSAMEHAEALANSLIAYDDPQTALSAWQAQCLPKANSLKRAADASADWLAHAQRAFYLPIEKFAFACVTRSLRLSYAHVRKADPSFANKLDALVAGPASGPTNETPPPMFAPYELRGMKTANRMVFSPMCMYSAHDGTVNDFHLAHLGARAMGGFGLIIAEMTNVTAQGRMTPGCAGMYKPEHTAAWKRIVDFTHEHTQAKIGIQLAHAGRKGSIGRSWEKYEPVKGEETWEVIAPSAIPFTPDRPIPREMSKADIQATTGAFEAAARMSEAAGFDMIELHFAHGYLLSEFISPLANHRGDAYGGSLENRMRFPLEVFEAVRAAFPAEKPISVRISANDFRPDGVTPEEAVLISRMLRNAGADIIAVSTAGVTADRRPAAMSRLYQLALSETIRHEAKAATMTVGGVISATDCNMIVASGRADMCAMARGALNDPYFPQHAAKQQGWRIKWPLPYDRAAETPVRAG